MFLGLRISILVLILTLAGLLASAHPATPVAGPDRHTPERFTPDSARIRNSKARARNKRLYDSIESKTSRRAVPRMLYNLLFVKPVLDTTENGQFLDETRALMPFAGKTISGIEISRQEPFDENGNWLERTGNKLHMITREQPFLAAFHIVTES